MSKMRPSQSWMDKVKARVRTLKARFRDLSYRGSSPQQIFEKIYASGEWGADGTLGYNSGTGSSDVFTQLYVETIREYIRTQGIRHIADLGCGDFRVGRQIIEGEEWDYTGVDIVRPLIEHLNECYAGPHVRFLCRDLIDEPLPDADLYLIRQIFQHLENEQIMKIVEKSNVPHVIVTEHLPDGPRVLPNRDKPAGPGARLYYSSGVFLEYPPFNCKLETLLEVQSPFNGRDAVLRTSLLLPRD